MWQARCRRRSPRSGTRSRCICHCTDPSTKRSTQSPGARSARARSRTVRPTRGSSTRRSCGMACAPSSSSMLGSVATRSTAIPTTRSGTRSSAELWSRISSTRLPTSFTPTTRAARFSADDQTGKATDKAQLQEETGLAVEPKAPLFGVIGRLVEQKGVDLLTAVAPWLLDNGAQLVILGTGEPTYEAKWKDLAAKMKGRLALTLGFDASLAQRIYAGADLFLMPSRFEPCGLGQLISLRYGTIPVVRAVGGLATTVHDVDADAGRGNGFSFKRYEAAAFADALQRALHRYRADGEPWVALRTRAMREDHSWTASAKRYVEMYSAAAKARRAA